MDATLIQMTNLYVIQYSSLTLRSHIIVLTEYPLYSVYHILNDCITIAGLLLVISLYMFITSEKPRAQTDLMAQAIKYINLKSKHNVPTNINSTSVVWEALITLQYCISIRMSIYSPLYATFAPIVWHFIPLHVTFLPPDMMRLYG